MSKKLWVGVAAASILLVYQFSVFNVLQDDAFISFRYVKNFLAGHGLVFNIGERVEGYTNFLWIMLLALLTKVGLPTIGTARTLGVLFSIGTLGVAAWGAYKYFPKRSWLWVLAVPFLLSANGSFAYWAGSGLETGLFTFLVASAAVTYLSYTPLSFCFLTLAALTRPEGALLAFLFGVIGILLKQKSWKTTLIFWGALALIMLPYALFKYFYFGSLLPNPFYAKTGFSIEYWKSGLEYSFLFLRHYGLYGAALLLPLLRWRKLNLFSRFGLLIFLTYSLYVIVIGGDVLKVHRFFVPVVILLYFPFTDLLYQLLEAKPYKEMAFITINSFLAISFFQLPRSYIKEEVKLKKYSNVVMTNAADFFARDQSVKSFALSAVGALPYYVGEHRVIDMLGLTDSVVAKHPEKIDGLISTWKERRYNAGYVLSQKPDVIMFTTGFKPSGLAERALFLYPDFRRNYRLELLYHKGINYMYYRRFQNLSVASKPDVPVRTANLINEGINRFGRNNLEAIELLRSAIHAGANDSPSLFALLSSVYLWAGHPESSEVYSLKAINLDGGGTVSRYCYRNTLRALGRWEEAAREDSLLAQMLPDAEPFLKAGGQVR